MATQPRSSNNNNKTKDNGQCQASRTTHVSHPYCYPPVHLNPSAEIIKCLWSANWLQMFRHAECAWLVQGVLFSHFFFFSLVPRFWNAFKITISHLHPRDWACLNAYSIVGDWEWRIGWGGGGGGCRRGGADYQRYCFSVRHGPAESFHRLL